MRCHRCKGKMEHVKRLEFNGYEIDGWRCKCGEIYFNPEQAQRILLLLLLLNKLKKEEIKIKLGKIRSNLILRVPKDVEVALGLHKGEKVNLRLDGNELKILPEK